MSEVELGWAAALLSPRDVAPHPNFWTDEIVTAYGALGLLTAGRHSDFARLATEGGDSERWSNLSKYHPLYESIGLSMTVGTVVDGALQILEHANDMAMTDGDPVLRTSCTILAAVALAEADRLDEADRALSALLAELKSDQSASARLLRAWMLCVYSQNRWDAGETPGTLADRAVRECDSIEIEELPSFALSRGSALDSEGCLRGIVHALQWSAQHQLVRTSTDWEARLSLVRAPTPTLAWRARGHVADAYAARVESSFDSVFAEPFRRRVSFGGDPVGDSALSEALLWHEYAGTAVVHHYRKLLGMSRFEQGWLLNENWQLAEGLRLLRHAHLEKQVNFACNSLLRQGPLSVLRDQAEDVSLRGLERAPISGVDLAVLKQAATILDDPVRLRTIEALIEVRKTTPTPRGMTWQDPLTYVEKIWEAIERLATASGNPADALAVLLSDVLDLPAENAEHADHTYSRLLGRWKADAWQDARVTRLLEDLRARTSSGELPEIRSALERITDLIIPDLADPAIDGEMNIALAARYVDRMLKDVAPIPPEVADELIPLLREQMAEVRRSASAGLYSGGGLSPADIAVAYMFVAGSKDLWSDVLELILDPAVQRDDKTRAIERMSRDPGKVPQPVREELGKRSADLLAGGPDFMGTAVKPYPPAVRLLSIIGALEPGEPLQFVAELMGKRSSQATKEAAQTVLALAYSGTPSEWLATTAIWLSFEADPDVRSLAGQALAHMSGSWNESGRANRLQTLLEEDGVFVPLRVLQGLRDNAELPPSNVRNVVASLAATHPSVEVRSAASEVNARTDSHMPTLEENPSRKTGLRNLVRRLVRMRWH